MTHFAASSAEEAQLVDALKSNYPYSQFLKVLAARVGKDHHLASNQTTLQHAAVYSTDRTVLKEIMSVEAPDTNAGNGKVASVADSPTITPTLPESHDYATEVVHDLERLQELKHNFESLFDQGDVAIPPSKQPKSEPPKKTSKKQRIIELAKALDNQAAETSETETKTPERKKASKRSSELDPIIKEIKTSRKKVVPETDKAKEQLEIIDQFIKTKPQLSPSTTPEDVGTDLASSLKSGEFGDHIVSETLAEILIRQGKKDKAIEVYKKLIWKFPQKKTYFAAQIENLKK
ncbi:MAG: hypothetical protein KF687_11790 [Cyclobacteriaceae bacterium]|nr:hypothetical protein [Cyclobacteriaceae bacterium]